MSDSNGGHLLALPCANEGASQISVERGRFSAWRELVAGACHTQLLRPERSRCAFAEGLKEILALLQSDHQSQDGVPGSVSPLQQRARPHTDNPVLAERGNRWRCRQCGADRAAAWRSRRMVVAT